MTDTQEMVSRLHKDRNGDPFLLTPAQDYLYRQIFKKLTPRLHVMSHTRWGKSSIVGLAVEDRCVIYPEKWAIIAGTKDKAQIIMDVIISHIFDNEFHMKRFLPDKNETMEDVRRYKNKRHLTFVINPDAPVYEQKLSEIFIGSAKDALGFGAENVIEDESALINDEDHALVMRMLGDDPQKNFLVKIGNPFRRNHFLRSYHDPKYKKIVIDCYQSLVDGRMTEELITEMKQEAFFDILYECKFPRENEIDEEGYLQLVTRADLEAAQARNFPEHIGIPRLGVDVAKGGRNSNAFVLRLDNYARVLDVNKEENSVKIAERVMEYMKTYNIPDNGVFVDDTGVGHGVSSILKEHGYKRVNATNFGDKANKDILLNLRAQAYAGEYSVAAWVKNVGQLERDDRWSDMLRIRYRKNVSNKTQIEPKESMIRDGRESPDVSDALALTFAKQKILFHTTVSTQNGSDPFAQTTQQPVSPFGGVGRFDI